MKKVRKLTVETLKRLIAEERQKIAEQDTKSKRRKLLLKQIKTLNALKRQQDRKLREAKSIYEARKHIKKLLSKGL